ncbi:hypothetical protein [Mesorhizobium dulcispinae]|uniref:hypothetical protein n=1 Tax=Mesorhizobium dulcispinae TaxID=3072316 RepID=UPI002A23B9AB|nr:hypothetical protein [Mesorhizobium sp. VK23D]MDX8517815.1 hypothetical protein [Mesorhizobium sp. VK23D]
MAADVAALRAEMKAGGRTLYEVTDGNVGRIIDMRWLKTDAARFRLVGVVNRLDRRDFAGPGGEAGCGEVRRLPRRCSPTYFLFQMRIDNHATPWAKTARAGISVGFGAAAEE